MNYLKLFITNVSIFLYFEQNLYLKLDLVFNNTCAVHLILKLVFVSQMFTLKVVHQPKFYTCLYKTKKTTAIVEFSQS